LVIATKPALPELFKNGQVARPMLYGANIVYKIKTNTAPLFKPNPKNKDFLNKTLEKTS
jgi:hypothetical protein